MPGYSNKRTHDMTTNKKWGGRPGNQRRDDRRPGSVQNRIGARPMVSPWENGVTPGMQSGLMNQHNFVQPITNSYLLNSGMNRGNYASQNFGGYGGNNNKLRRMDRMGGFDDQRGRGLLPSPSNTPLLGVAPPAFPPARVPDFLQQRMGIPWESSSSFRSGGPRGMNSGYYPSNRGRQDNSRKFVKAKRPLTKSSTSSSSNSKGNSSSRDGKGRVKGVASSNKSPSVRERDDKERASPHSKELKNKQGEHSPTKSERSNDKKKEGDEDDTGKEEDEEIEGEEGTTVKKEDGDETKKEDETDEKQEKEKPQEDPFPVLSLYCHICELDSFSSKKGYIRHLQGITHAKMSEMFHAKNAATLELLNISAKLAEMRQRDKVLRRTGKKGQPVMKTTEQILVQKWLKVGSCCGTKYKSPFGLEEHKLSIHHLRAKYLEKQKDEVEVEEGKPIVKIEGEEAKPTVEGEEEVPIEPIETKPEVKEELDQFVEDSHDEVIRLSAMLEKAEKESEENPLTMQTISVYNPSLMMGLEYIKKELRFRCRACKGQMFKSLENHAQSHAHFDSIASLLNKIEDVKREEKRKKDEAEEEEKRKQKEIEKAKEEEKKKAALEEEKKALKEAEKQLEEEEDAKEEEGIPSDFITVDCSDDKEKSDDEPMDEDVIPLGEEEERILNATDEPAKDEEEAEAADEEVKDEDADLAKDIFEEVGEKIDFEDDLKKQLENGKKPVAEEEPEEVEEADEDEAVSEPPPKRAAYTPRRRGKARGRGRSAK